MAQNKVAKLLKQLERVRAKGDGFATFDASVRAHRAHPESLALAYHATLHAARIGAFTEALRLFEQNQIEQRAGSGEGEAGIPVEDLLALAARLKKDRAIEATDLERVEMLRQAAEAYLAVFERTRGYYPLINVATIYALAGDREKSSAFARESLAIVRALPPSVEPRERLWRLLTEVEARLVLGEVERARVVAASAATIFTGDYGDLSTTVKQLGRLVATTGLAFDVGAELGMPAVLHYAGHMIAAPGARGRFSADQEKPVQRAIDAFLQSTRVGWAYGSLAAGADILIAEQLLTRGIQVHVVLPFQQSDFLEVSVVPSGDGWVRRFEKCLAKASSVRTVIEGSYFHDDGLFATCSAYALGLARLQARDLCAELRQLLVWDGVRDATAVAGTAVDYQLGEEFGVKLHIIPIRASVVSDEAANPSAAGGAMEVRHALRQRRPRAMVFCDVVGFSRICDDDLHAFHERIMRPMAEDIRSLSRQPSVIETWGDAVFLAYDDVEEAATAAMTLCKSIDEDRTSSAKLPSHLAVRVSAHYGETLDITNPFTGQPACLGIHVSRAARIEPITPPGVVYVSEAFAARLAIKSNPAFRTEFVGTTKLAKKFGSLPVFRLVGEHRDQLPRSKSTPTNTRQALG